MMIGFTGAALASWRPVSFGLAGTAPAQPWRTEELPGLCAPCLASHTSPLSVR